MQQTADESLQLPAAQRVLNIDTLQVLPIYRQRQLLHHWLGQDEPLPPAKQLVDDVWNLTQRSDHDHQTELFWQARTHSYVVRRYRQQLYRLSNEWLSWLDRPLMVQAQPLSSLDLTTNDSADSDFALLTVRRSEDYIWQLQVYPDVLARLIESHIGALNAVLNIKPLDRKQRVQTALATRSQSGKKLYQTLGIPLWLRESLVVVSVVLLDKEHAKNEIPILLLSPFDRWILKNDFSINTKNLGSDIDDVFKNVISVVE
jgi:tRNA(Ile)-lysidine synthase